MAAHTLSASAAHGVTRGKLILIGVLAVVFVAVVYWNYFRDASAGDATLVQAQSPPANRPAASAAKAAARPNPAAAARETKSPPPDQAASNPGEVNAASQREPWPQFELAHAIAHDPFALPAQFPQLQPSPAQTAAIQTEELEAEKERAAAQERAATLAEIKRQGVKLVFQNGREYVARIGDKEVRVGDRIGGLRVVDISLHGVTLEGESSP
jgi:hypothetical protein